jgi:hypothetical protein
MPNELVHLFRCPNQKCTDFSVLPRQSHLGDFATKPSPAKDIWPIRYLCRSCGLASEIPVQAIHTEGVEMPVQNQLVRYDFSSDQSGSLVSLAVYSKERRLHRTSPDIRREDPDAAIEHVLRPFGVWQGSHGDTIQVRIDFGLSAELPKH